MFLYFVLQSRFWFVRFMLVQDLDLLGDLDCLKL